MSKRRHIFVSHHHKDDVGVSKMTDLLGSKGYDVRNSSIRVSRENNIQRLKNGKIKDSVLKRAIQMKIKWSSSVVVLIGKKTHTRDWVNWEIKKAHAEGKRIVGVHMHNHADADIPEALKQYASAIVGWNSKRMIDAIDGKINTFETPGGGQQAPMGSFAPSNC